MIQGNCQDIRRGCVLFSRYDKDCKCSLLAIPSSWSILHAGAGMPIPFPGLVVVSFPWERKKHHMMFMFMSWLQFCCTGWALPTTKRNWLWSGAKVLYSSKFSLQDIGIGNISCYLHWRYFVLYSSGEKSADAEDLLAHFESYEWHLAGTPKKPWSLCPHPATRKGGLIHWIKWVYDDFFLFFLRPSITWFPFKFPNSWDVCSHQIFSCCKLRGSIVFRSDSLLVLSSFFGHCTVFPFLSLLSPWAALQMWPLHSPRLGQILSCLRQVWSGPPKIEAVLGPQTVSQQGMCEALICPHLWGHRICDGWQVSRKVPSCPSLPVRCEVFWLLERGWHAVSTHCPWLQPELPQPSGAPKTEGKEKFWSWGLVLLLAWQDQLLCQGWGCRKCKDCLISMSWSGVTGW